MTCTQSHSFVQKQTASSPLKCTQTSTNTRAHSCQHIQSDCDGLCVLSGEFHQLFISVTVGKFMTVLDKTINNITRTTQAHIPTHTAELLSFMCCLFEDKEGVVHYIIMGKITSLHFTFYHSAETSGRDGEKGKSKG